MLAKGCELLCRTTVNRLARQLWALCKTPCAGKFMTETVFLMNLAGNVILHILDKGDT